jgi:Mycothiol maleylpyruvate isomerase N-terminal domain
VQGGDAALATVPHDSCPCQTQGVPANMLNATRADATALLTAAETDWARPVPHCPAWDQAQLVRHTGGIFAWMAAIVISRGQVSRRTLDPAPTDLPAWYLHHLEETSACRAGPVPQRRTTRRKS